MSIVRCPNCLFALVLEDRVFRCGNGHAFDRSKEGYVNLLLPNRKKSLNPGDNKTMIHAREAFLSEGHYDFLITEIEGEVANLSAIGDDSQILDLGCGSGYYTRNIFKEKKVNRTGIDISKVGIAIAAKKDKAHLYIVGSIFDLPIIDQTADVILNIFAPIKLDEVKRASAPGGLFIKVVPGTSHMKEIAALAYEVIRPHTSSIVQDIEAQEGIQLLNRKQIKKVITLKAEQLGRLISMTPYVYKFNEERLAQLSKMKVTLEFEVIIAKVTGAFGSKKQ